MKTIWLVVAFAFALAVTALGFGQMAIPQVGSTPAQQLQQTAVSDLHIGAAVRVKNPYAGDANAWMQGKRLFKAMNCSGCHAAGGGGGMGPALSDGHWIYGGSPGQIYLSIAQGRPNGMPQWGTALPPKTIWELVAYVKSLSQPNPRFEPRTSLGVKPMPGNTPHPAAARIPPRGPVHPKPTPKPPYPAPASTPGVPPPAAPASTSGRH
jgi:cytochrome c oxidase cbb3-type subunit 3